MKRKHHNLIFFEEKIAKNTIFLVVSKFSHYKRVRCENVERQHKAAGGLAKCEKREAV